MKKGRSRINSKGSSLIMVVIGAAFLGILGALILSITYANIDLKTANNKSKKNFYVEEVAVNELTARLEELSATSMETAYSWLVKNYQKESSDVAKMYKEYRRQYMITLSNKLNNTPGVMGTVANRYNINVLQDGIRSFSRNRTDESYAIVEKAPGTQGIIEVSSDFTELILKDLFITYKDKFGYETNIKTDIVMEFPKVGGVDTTFSKFALISDTYIHCKSALNVNGGVYAGKAESDEEKGAGDAVNKGIGGIQVEGSSGHLVIDGKGNLVATRGNITACNESKLSIKNANVWAKNILTFGTGDERSLTPAIDIDGITKVQDDLIMKAPSSSITLKNSYFGFSYKNKSATTGKTTSDTSSAITINAKDVSLDLKGLDNLVLFGRAFISSSDTGSTVTGSEAMMDIMTGQSIGVKKDQGAYLIPKESYLKIACNPIDQTTLQNYATNICQGRAGYDPHAPHLSLSMKNDIVDFSNKKLEHLKTYLDPNMPIRAIYYKQGTGVSAQNMVNFYWNFKDEQCANAYFEWYYNGHKGEMQDKYKEYYHQNGSSYGLGMKDSYNRLSIAGDILRQKASGEFEIIQGNTTSMDAESKQITKAYNSVGLNLREDGDATKSLDANPYVDKHFEVDNIKKLSTDSYKTIVCTGIKSTISGRDAKVYISNEPEFHVVNGMCGLVIASGKVVVDALEFEGLIVADGQIQLYKNSTISADEKMILDILSYCQNKGESLSDYIKGYEKNSKGASGDDSIDYSASISFENWKKNA